MTTCPTCGRPTSPPIPQASDREIIAGIEAHPSGMIYAAGRGDGSADRRRWFVTYGQPKGPFSLERVMRLVSIGSLVPYLPGKDDGYTTPRQAKWWLEKMEERERAQRYRRLAA